MKKEKINFGNFDPNKIKLINMTPIGRSSSVFIQGLLDGHSEIITLPGFFYIKDEDFKGLSFKIIVDNLHKRIEYYFKSLLGKSNLNEVFPKNFLYKYLKEYVESFGLDKKTLFIGTHYAYAKYSRKNIEEIRYILAHTHTLLNTFEFAKLFPNLKIIFTLRDPRANYESCLKNKQSPITIFFTQYNHYILYKKLIKKKRKNIIVIKHEELHENYPKIKKELINFLNIKDEKILDSATFFNQPFYGMKGGPKSSTNIYLDKPNPNFNNKFWKEGLSTSEIKFIQLTFSGLMKTFNYKKIKSFEPLSVRVSGELYKTISLVEIEKKKGFRKKLTILARLIYKIPLIGLPIIKIFIFFNIFGRFSKELIKIKLSRF